MSLDNFKCGNEKCGKALIQKTGNKVSFFDTRILISPKGSFFRCKMCGYIFDLTFAKCDFTVNKCCTLIRIK